MQNPSIIVAITGASGAIYAKSLLQKLNEFISLIGKVAIIFSKQGREVWDFELGKNVLNKISFPIFNNDDFYAPFASGSSDFHAMVVCPCSMGTLGRIANGTSENLIGRAADVMLKERRKLILVTRESPLNLIHINNMKTVTEAGGIIMPASPSFYSKPETLEEAVTTITMRIFDQLGISVEQYRWGK